MKIRCFLAEIEAKQNHAGDVFAASPFIKKPCSKNRWGRKINPDRTKRDKEGLGIKYTKLSLNFLGANCRSINNKQSSISDILESRAVDVVFFFRTQHEKTSKFKGFNSFCKTSK